MATREIKSVLSRPLAKPVPQEEKVEAAANRNRTHYVTKRIESRNRPGLCRSRSHRRRLLQNWISPRASGSQWLRAFIRAHDVSRLRQRPQDAAHKAHQFQRWRAQRIHA